MNSDDWFLTSVVAVGLIAGYSIVSFVATKLKSQQQTGPGEGQAGQSQQEEAKSEACESQSEEEKYARVLGLSTMVTAADVRRAYRELLTKYHPDKVKHLGAEFTSIAEVKTRKILEAYDYFRKKYDIR
jgi:DnaJ like chaperone protein